MTSGVGIGASVVAALLGLLLGLPSVGAAESSSLCGPVEGRIRAATEFEVRESGITAPVAGRGGAGDAVTRGEITRLPAAAPPPPEPDRESEALLALPKDPSGAIPTDFELGPGARIAQSFFSPVTCATVALVKGPPGAPLDQLVAVVPETGLVVPNDVYASAAAEVAPAPPLQAREPDPYAPLQYGLAATGVRRARGLADGSGVRVALLDSAPESEHRDLGTLELRAPSDSDVGAVGVHGTLMAGVIHAVEDNGFGIAGVAPGAVLVSIPICVPSGGAGGRCTIFDLIQGLDLAWEAETQIVNLSLSGPPNALLERGVARLDELGVVVVAAAGNEGGSEPRFPAAYPSVVGVGAVDRAGRAFPRSNRGPWVELLAPGVEVLSTVPGSAFAFGDGTSLAAAHVTGLLAVLTSVTKDPKLARSELFRAAHSETGGGVPPRLPQACSVFERLALSCEPTSLESTPDAPDRP